MAHEPPPLLIVSGIQGDPRRYRAFHLYEQARLAGLKCELSYMADPDLKKKVEQSGGYSPSYTVRCPGSLDRKSNPFQGWVIHP
jgi:hypothetical protein